MPTLSAHPLVQTPVPAKSDMAASASCNGHLDYNVHVGRRDF